jgi:hypothetical protein
VTFKTAYSRSNRDGHIYSLSTFVDENVVLLLSGEPKQMSLFLRGKTWWSRIVHKGKVHQHSMRTTGKREAERKELELKLSFDAETFGDKPGEIWRVVRGFGTYEVSNLGRVRLKSTQRALKPRTSGNNPYRMVNLEGTEKLVHILVAQGFIPNPQNKPEVNHKRGRAAGDGVGNLEWATKAENMKHYATHGKL